MKLLLFLCSLICLSHSLSQAAILSAGLKSDLMPVAAWIDFEAPIAAAKLKANISPVGTVSGVVVASPQKEAPNYFRNWIRDSALTMSVIFQLWQNSEDPVERTQLDKLLENYTFFSLQNQLSASSAGLGEPIFEVSGVPFQGPWGRPQNDGAALRAITLMNWAQALLDENSSAGSPQETFVRKWLYSSQLPAKTVIKTDLEYVSHHWQDSSFDLWEEVRGQHFFTEMVQRKALVLGARLADRLGDPAAAAWYRAQAHNLESLIESHWDEKLGYLKATVDWREGANYKDSQLDVAVLLGVLHGSVDGYFAAADPQVQKTFSKLVDVFQPLYQVNQFANAPGVALGRYPEDKYSGADFEGGNPWVLTTLAAAQLCYEASAQTALQNPTRARTLQMQGDQFLQRVQYHSNPDGSLSEQIHRQSGYMISARDLTWNYAAILTAFGARKHAVAQLKMSSHHLQKQTR